MFVTITNENSGHVSLDTPIDNRGGDKSVAIREMFYSIIWNNISEELGNNWITFDGQKHTIKDGYYKFCSLAEKLFEPHGIQTKLNPANMTVSLTMPVKDHNYYVDISAKLAKQLGFKFGRFLGDKLKGETTGTHEINLNVNRMLYIHLSQLSTSDNLFNGKPSQILRVIPASKAAFCETENMSFTGLQFKKLECGCFDSLSIEIRNARGRLVRCGNLVIVLEIK